MSHVKNNQIKYYLVTVFRNSHRKINKKQKAKRKKRTHKSQQNKPNWELTKYVYRTYPLMKRILCKECSHLIVNNNNNRKIVWDQFLKCNFYFSDKQKVEQEIISFFPRKIWNKEIRQTLSSNAIREEELGKEECELKTVFLVHCDVINHMWCLCVMSMGTWKCEKNKLVQVKILSHLRAKMSHYLIKSSDKWIKLASTDTLKPNKSTFVAIFISIMN